MIFIKINNILYPSEKIEGKIKDEKWNDRESKTITLSMSYEEGLNIFTNNINWYIIAEQNPRKDELGNLYTPDPIEYDNSEFCLAGPITDNRDGTDSIKMGKMTEAELVQKELEETLAIMYAEV